MPTNTANRFDIACQAGKEAALLILAGRNPTLLNELDHDTRTIAYPYVFGYLASHFEDRPCACWLCEHRRSGEVG